MHDASVAALTAVREAQRHGEDQFIRARERFRQQTQILLDEFRQLIQNNPGITGTDRMLTAKLVLMNALGRAAQELDKTIVELKGAGFSED